MHETRRKASAPEAQHCLCFDYCMLDTLKLSTAVDQVGQKSRCVSLLKRKES